MASTNGILSPPPQSGSADDSITLSAKRKRDDSVEGHDHRNSTSDSKGAAAAEGSTESTQKLILDLVDVLKGYDTIPSILTRSLPDRASSAEPQAKRQKAEDVAETQNNIMTRTASNVYSNLDEVLEDVDAAVSDIMEKLQLPNGATRNQFIPSAASQSEMTLKVSAFKKRAHELVERENARIEQEKAAKSTGISSKVHMANGTKPLTQINAGSADAKMALTLFGNAPHPRQLFSSFQIPTKINGESKDVMQYIREAGLPTGINTTQIVPVQSSSLVEDSKRVTMGDVFPTPANIPAMQPPKPSKVATTRSANVGWYQPTAADPFPRVASYFKAPISCGQWLDYSNAAPPQNSKKRQRDRAMSLGGAKAPQVDAEPSESLIAKLDAAFRSAYSSFAPTKDDSAAVAPTGVLERIWWQNSGEKTFERMVENAKKFEEATTYEGDTGETVDSDEELKKFEELVKNWDDDAIDPSLVPLVATTEKSAEEKDVDEILEDISELLETLNSYQRIRHMSLNPLGRPPGLLSAPDTSFLGTPSKPSDSEQCTYEMLKAQLSLMIATLPPYAVAKLDPERIADLSISTKIEIQTDNYRGVMDEDENGVKARTVAAATSSSAVRAVPPTTQHRSSSSALYGNQYSAPRATAAIPHQYYGAQTPIRPPQNLQRPPPNTAVPYPAQRPAAAAPYRPTTTYNTPTYPHQAARPAQPQYPPSNPPQFLQTPGAQSYMRTPNQAYQNIPQSMPQAAMNGRYAPQPTYAHQAQPSQNGIDYRYGNSAMPRQLSPQKPMYSPQPNPAQPRPSYSTPTPAMPQNQRQYLQNPIMNGATTQAASQPQFNPHQPTQMTNYSTFMTQEQQSSMMERQRAQLAAQQATAQQQARNAAQAALGSPSKAPINGSNAVAAGLEQCSARLTWRGTLRDAGAGSKLGFKQPSLWLPISKFDPQNSSHQISTKEMATPTLIESGTPNSTTTSLSALSTTAIKDGHRGHAFPQGRGHHHTPSSNTLEAERADRISRLAGLERVSTARPPNPNLAGGAAGNNNAGLGQIPGYFDQNGNPVYTTKMSTVGSASATGSVGGRTSTWASGSAKAQTDGDDDEMSMDTNYRDMEADRYSASAIDEDMEGDGMSDDTSLVGFGEGAGSTVSGPIYSRRDIASSPAVAKSALAAQLQSSVPGTPASASTTMTTEQQRRDARMLDGLAADEPATGYVDTAARDGRGVSMPGRETAERILRERLDGDGEARKPPLGSPDEAGLGKFYFEDKK
ncbi:hypothetical protein G7Y89_g2967 [Cudoniella acicularis]|uniref:Uncharacterized protein n=1 Tax=Cudoniella acicularis TaxID=354080 RepID=A0A8H4W847_9HELO|nr:hypothetical protein G7Y89_g2967 [Cudoniella acicularis]